MGKVKFGIDSDDAINAEAGEGGNFYDGPVPPKGSYRGILKRLELIAENSKGNPMLRYLIELKADPGSDNALYDGYGVWGHQNVTDQGKGYVNAFLDALTDGTPEGSLTIRKAFWGGQMVVEDDGEGHVVRIGKMNIDSPDCTKRVAFVGKRAKNNGEDKLEVAKWLISKGKEEEIDMSKLEELPDDLRDEDPTDPWASSDDDDDTEPETTSDDDSTPLF